MTAQLMTQAEFARHRGVSKPAVSNWKKAGLLVLQENDAGRIMVNVERTDAKLNAKLDPMRGRPPSGSFPSHSAADAAPPSPAEGRGADSELPLGSSERSLAEERVEELRERRIGAALKNAVMAGDLVPLIEAERRVAECGRVARERMQSWLRGIAERFAAVADVRTIMSLGEEGIDQVFAELASAAARGDLSGDEDDLTPEENAELEAAADAELVE